MKTSYHLIGRQVTLAHSSAVSQIIIRLLDDLAHDLRSEKDSDLEQASRELDDFLLYVWIQTGDTAFNRSGLRNATDKLIDFLSSNDYYYEAHTGLSNKEKHCAN